MTKIAVLPGDGIGKEIVAEAVKVLKALGETFEMETAPVGGAGYEAKGHPLPEDTLKLAKEADAILFGAVGDWKYDTLPRELRPEQAILGLRAASTRPTCWRPSSSGRTSSPTCTRSTRTSSCRTCMSTTPPCSSSRRRRTST
jgi:3-isopropylmalate dehydrogenase